MIDTYDQRIPGVVCFLIIFLLLAIILMWSLQLYPLIDVVSFISSCVNPLLLCVPSGVYLLETRLSAYASNDKRFIE